MLVLCNKIKEIRRFLKLTQDDLASLVHMSQQAIWEIEFGRRFPTAYNAGLICRALGKNFEDVFYYKEV